MYNNLNCILPILVPKKPNEFSQNGRWNLFCKLSWSAISLFVRAGQFPGMKEALDVKRWRIANSPIHQFPECTKLWCQRNTLTTVGQYYYIFERKCQKSRFHLLPVWPGWAIYWTLGNFSKPVATLTLLKCPLFFVNLCKGFKSFNFSSEIIFGQLLDTFGLFLVTLSAA